MPETCHIAGGEHAVGGRAPQLVHNDAAVDGKPGLARQGRARLGADGHQHALGEVRQRPRVETEVHAMRSVHAGEVRAELWPEHTKQRLLQSLMDSDRASLLPRRRGHLAADEAGADDVEA